MDQYPWSRSYRAVRVKMARNTPPDGLRKDRMARILEDTFIARRVEQGDEVHWSQIPQTHEEKEQDLRTTD